MISYNKLPKKNGFTIVELLLYIGLFTILLSVITSFFSLLVDSQLESQSSSSVEQDTKYLYAKLNYDITHAQSVVDPANLGGIASSLTLVSNSVQSTYQIQDGNLIISSGGNSNRLNGYLTKINSFQVQRLGNSSGKPTLKITIEVESRVFQPKGAEKRLIQTTISLR